MKNIVTADYAMQNTIGTVRRSFAMRLLLLAFSGMKMKNIMIFPADYAMRNTTRTVRRISAMWRLLPAFSGMKNIITADYAMRNTPGAVRRSSAGDSSLMRPSRQTMAVHPHAAFRPPNTNHTP